MTLPRRSDFGRWPWSWPVEIPCVLRDDKGTIHLTSRGTIYDTAANVGAGYEGTHTHDEIPRYCEIFGPMEFGYKIGRSYLRKQLREGAVVVIAEGETA